MHLIKYESWFWLHFPPLSALCPTHTLRLHIGPSHRETRKLPGRQKWKPRLGGSTLTRIYLFISTGKKIMGRQKDCILKLWGKKYWVRGQRPWFMVPRWKLIWHMTLSKTLNSVDARFLLCKWALVISPSCPVAWAWSTGSFLHPILIRWESLESWFVLHP